MASGKIAAPSFWLIAGPNGSGKSSLYGSDQRAIYGDTNIADAGHSFWIINPDLLTVRIRTVEQTTLEEANLEAVRRIENWLKASINAHQSVGAETVPSTDKYRSLVLAAKNKGFEFRLVYVVLRSPEINIKRVQMRVAKGGHDVPADRIVARWQRSLDQLPWFLDQADWALLFDNSEDLRLIGRKAQGTVTLDPSAPDAIKSAVAKIGADRRSMIIAIDGPAASGKGTLGKRLAAHYGLRHLDTGLIYRAVAKAIVDGGYALDDVARAAAAAHGLDPTRFDEAALKSHALGSAASVVSAIPEVRAALLKLQRDFAATPPGAVLDGRDIGTVICPDADAKIFVIASPEVRARRRAAEMRGAGATIDDREVLADIVRRDERDSNRAIAPLVAASDAVTLDTTNLDIEGAVRAAIAVIDLKRR